MLVKKFLKPCFKKVARHRLFVGHGAIKSPFVRPATKEIP